MALSTIERAYQLARSGEAPDFASLKRRLQSEGCRAVDALLAQRSLRSHLEAICAAAFRPIDPLDPAQTAEPKAEQDAH